MGRGSVFKRPGAATFSVVVSWTDATTGKRHQKWASARTEKEAERVRTRLLTQLDKGELSAPSPETLVGYLDTWLDGKARDIQGGTLRNYRIAIRQIAAGLGRVKLERLTPAQVQAFYVALEREVSAHAVANCHNVLGQAYAQALRWGMVSRNPVAAVDPPRLPVKPRPVWDHATREAFADRALASDRALARLWVVLAYTGLRLGEGLGLRWGDVDWERHVLTVGQAQKRTAEGAYAMGAPKSAAGERVAPLPARAAEALWAERREQNARRLKLGEAWTDLGLCFDRGDGGALGGSAASARFHRLVRAWGFPVLRAHDLRHTFNSLAIEDGVPLPIAARLMGHATTRMTQHYLQVDRTTAARMTEVLDAAEAARRGQDASGTGGAT